MHMTICQLQRITLCSCFSHVLLFVLIVAVLTVVVVVVVLRAMSEGAVRKRSSF